MTSTNPIVTVAYADVGNASDGFQRSRVCSLPAADVVARLKAEIETADLWVLHEIDPQALLQRGGYAIGKARQILFFHPRLVVRLLTADPAALLEAPLKFAILELPDGRVMVRWIDPLASFGRYGIPALTALGEELAATCEAIVTATVRRPD